MSDKLTTASSKTGDNTHSPVNDRRNFIKKGALAAPLIASVASRPVWACSVSGHMSGNLSQHSEDACTAPANASNWSYWAEWIDVFNFISANGTEIGNDSSIFLSKISGANAGNAYIFDTTDPQSPINALFNWYEADNAATGLAPTENTGSYLTTTKTTRGDAIANGSMEEMRFVAALLNAAHPSIEFPYSSNQWTVSYIADNAGSMALDELLEQWFVSPIPPTLDGVMTAPGVTDGFTAYQWARQYLFGVTS